MHGGWGWEGRLSANGRFGACAASRAGRMRTESTASSITASPTNGAYELAP